MSGVTVGSDAVMCAMRGSEVESKLSVSSETNADRDFESGVESVICFAPA